MEGNPHDFERDIPDDLPETPADEAAASEAGGVPALAAIRDACLACMGAKDGEGRRTAARLVSECDIVICPLHAFRFGRKPDPATVDRTVPLRPIERGMLMGLVMDHNRQRRTAIRLQCLDCVGFERREIAACTTWRCRLYQLRLGTGHPVDHGDVVERRKLWLRIGHDAYVAAMNELLCSDEGDATTADGPANTRGLP